jgi:hypothetical protein
LNPEKMSSNRSLTKSQARSLLSIARLKIARSRLDPAISSLTRMDQTCFGSSGFFWPISNPLFQGAGFYRLDVPTWEGLRRPALRVARPRANQCIPIRWSGPIERTFDRPPIARSGRSLVRRCHLRSSSQLCNGGRRRPYAASLHGQFRSLNHVEQVLTLRRWAKAVSHAGRRSHTNDHIHRSMPIPLPGSSSSIAGKDP